MSDCHGELSALFRCLKRVSAFAPSTCISANLFKWIPHRSGRAAFSSRFRGPTSLILLCCWKSARPIEGAVKEKPLESDGSRGSLLSTRMKDLSLSSGLSIDDRQSCQRSFDLFNLVLFGACQHPEWGQCGRILHRFCRHGSKPRGH